MINSAGMDTKAAASALTMPAVPSGLEAMIGDHDGGLDLSWDPVAGAGSYVNQRSADPPTVTSWTHVNQVEKDAQWPASG